MTEERRDARVIWLSADGAVLETRGHVVVHDGGYVVISEPDLVIPLHRVLVVEAAAPEPASPHRPWSGHLYGGG